jgi:hypothetical protein
MHDIVQIGYMPGYSGNDKYKFTKQLSKRVVVSFDTVNTDMSADFRVLVQCEPPNLYIKFKDMVIENADKFHLILTYDERLFHLPHAVNFCPVGSWIEDGLLLEKRNQITYLMSSKINGAPYIMRFMIKNRIERKTHIGPFELFWHRSPPVAPSKNPFFANAKFNIATENQDMNNMFTEKLLDCFKTFTVPIYYGCTNIEEFFDPRGIIQFRTIEEFENIIANLTPEVYDRMLPYAEINHEKAKPFWEKNIYQRIEDIIENKLNFALEQENSIYQQVQLN